MRPVGTALSVRHKGLSQRTIRAELQGAAVDEGAIGKYDLVAVSGGSARNRSTEFMSCLTSIYNSPEILPDVRPHGRLPLHGLAECDEALSRAQSDRLNDIGAMTLRLRIAPKA